MELYMVHDISKAYLGGFVSLIYWVYLVITNIYKNKIWKYETYLFLLCMVCIVFDYVFTMILSCTNFNRLYVTVFWPYQASLEVKLIGAICVFWIVSCYDNWNVNYNFKESVPFKTRRICKKISALLMHIWMLVNAYWYWILIINFSIK